jgi:hypothetical protein
MAEHDVRPASCKPENTLPGISERKADIQALAGVIPACGDDVLWVLRDAGKYRRVRIRESRMRGTDSTFSLSVIE